MAAKRAVRIVLALAVVLTLTACAAGTPDAARAASGGPVSQLVLGFWHGIIAPVTLIVEVIHRFIPGVLNLPWHLYETGAASVPYDVGFFFGLGGGPTFIFSRWR
ncbi:MAG TPA: hypothetical protein VG248_12245 [Caulobacteraceae bacterium]|nr:hypothetical protein [Caulobacteraceae bacterium]